jgi:hypothetical protein
MNKLADLEKRANDALDGMSVSKDRLARDVLVLVAEVKRLRNESKAEIPSAGAAFADYIFGGAR